MKRYVYIVTLMLVLPLLASAAAISTTDFGNLKEGMTEAEVLRRVGEPDAIKDEGPMVGVRRGTGGDLQGLPILRRTEWFYTAEGTGMLPAMLTFEHGRLVNKWKGR
jgi:hypothetical protein